MNNLIVPISDITINDCIGIRDLRIPLHPKATVISIEDAEFSDQIASAIDATLGTITARVPGGQKFKTFADTTVTCENGLSWKRNDRGNLHNAIDNIIEAALNEDDVQPPLPLVASFSNGALFDIVLCSPDNSYSTSRFYAYKRALHTENLTNFFSWLYWEEYEERIERCRVEDFSYKSPILERVRETLVKANLRCTNPRIAVKPCSALIVDYKKDDYIVLDGNIANVNPRTRNLFALVFNIAARMEHLNPPSIVGEERSSSASEAGIFVESIDNYVFESNAHSVIEDLVGAFPNTQFIFTSRMRQLANVIGSKFSVLHM